jgi:2-succinyl-5-enolpyruvyl-6-hydroxy-3-cyclohexene-1-carboxylate synthase
MTTGNDRGVSFQAAQAAWARTLVRSLYDAGATHFVTSPGSRSTPLLAALEALGIARDVIVDERSAGFFALGRSKLTNAPSVLVCTSGSAPFHYFPALLEADESRTPLIVLSADRPPELQGNRSFQTTEQRHLFGARVRWFDDLGVAEASESSLLGLRRKAAQAVATSLGPTAGPVHLNAPFRKPLEPEGAELASERAVCSRPVRKHFQQHAAPDPEAFEAVVRRASAAQRPVLSLGPHAPRRAPRKEAVKNFAQRTHWPLFAEATSNAPERDCPAFDTVWRALARPESALRRAAYLPDLVLQIGNVPTSASWLGASRDLPRIVLAEGECPDPTNTAELVLGGDPSAWLALLAQRVFPADPAFVQRWQRANALATEVADSLSADVGQVLAHEGQAMRALGEALHPSDLLFVGNSLPVRLVDSFATIRVACLSQRGHNGIDGLIAGAAGAACAHPGHTVLLLGDISFLHDVGSLACVSSLCSRLTLVVLNNGGGRLFEQLPIAQSGVDLSPWLTPHTTDLSRIATAFGVASRRVDTARDLSAALSDARAATKPTFVEVIVPPSGTAAAYRTLVEGVSGALAQETQ